MIELAFDAVVWEWRGPAPYYFLTVPDELCDVLREVSGLVSYGWGMIPAEVTVGETTVKTSLFPREGGYAVPLKDALRTPEGIGVGNEVVVRLRVRD